METVGQTDQTTRVNCVGFYRRIIRSRRLIFEAYRDGRDFSDAQVLALMVALYTAGEGADKLLARIVGQEEGNLNEAFVAQLRGVSQTEGENTVGDLWKLLAHFQFKGLRGPRFRGRTRALFLDSILLFGCPNGYAHLFRDDLTLRLEEHPLSRQPQRKRDRWKSFYRAAKASEMSSKRIWMATHDEPPERPPDEWAIKVARRKGLMADDARPL